MYFYYNKLKIEQGQLSLNRMSVELLPTQENEILYTAEKPFIGYPILEGETIRPATRVELIGLGLDKLKPNEEIVDGEINIITPPTLTLAEQAAKISLTKREFLKIILALTKDMVNPETGESMGISLKMIEDYVAIAPDEIRLEWDYATYIERDHPALDGVAMDFHISSDMLDIIFVHAQDFLYKIDNNLPLHDLPESTSP